MEFLIFLQETGCLIWWVLCIASLVAAGVCAFTKIPNIFSIIFTGLMMWLLLHSIELTNAALLIEKNGGLT